MTRHALSERLLLSDLLDQLGPDAPTLCEGWATRDLAAHLVLRDSRPDLLVGLYVPALHGRMERERVSLAGGDYRTLVARVRSGPPGWNPMSVAAVDEQANLTEFFIHHEDVRRAQPNWEPRSLPDELQSSLWSNLRRFARLFFRRSATGIVLVAPGVGRHAAKLPDEHGTVVLRGAPAELLLVARGRGDRADVKMEGDEDDVAALRQSTPGLS